MNQPVVDNAPNDLEPPPARQQQSQTGLLWAGLAVVTAWTLYYLSAAPGLTWAHQGADGGELLAAAVANGVPHPPGYPLYTMALRLWLFILGPIMPASDIARQGNLFSAFWAGLSAGLVTLTAGSLLAPRPGRWLWATIAGMAWATSPMLWSQAIITEVYALHSFIVALLGWVVLVKSHRLWYLVFPAALGVAHHVTIVLLTPAAIYWLWTQERTWRQLGRILAWMAAGGVLGALLYLRIPWVASAAPPVNWGYADNWQGFWWLVSGAAYRGYLFAGALGATLNRLAAWAYTLTLQFTPVGLALSLVGLAAVDRDAPRLRNFALLWLTPISVYAIIYYTRDSDLYLLPVVWLMALLLAIGIQASYEWLAGQGHRFSLFRWMSPPLFASLLALGLATTTALRWPALSLATDVEAQDYLARVAAVLEPGSIVVSRSDQETFAMWYGVWASAELTKVAPGIVPLNDSLYQFDWYRRLQAALHPDVEAIGESFRQVLAANAGRRPIFFAEELPVVDSGELTPVGPLWRFDPE